MAIAAGTDAAHLQLPGKPSSRPGLLGSARNAAASTVRRALSLAARPRALLRWLVTPNLDIPGHDHGAPLRDTAYLDGLRGWAAYMVYWHHHNLWAHSFVIGKASDILENAWGYKGQYNLATFYGARLFFTGGHMAVAIFYVISGYVLTHKSLKLTIAGQPNKVAEVVASALFRRWFRLFLPLIGTTFAYITSWHLLGLWTPQAEPQDTYLDEVWNWYVEFKNFSFLFKDGALWPSYNGHLWSIPLEMRGSVVCYVAILCLARASTRARLLCEAGLVVYFLYVCDAWYAAAFMSGMLQADLDILAKLPQATSGFPRFLRDWERHKKWFVYGCLFIAVWFSGVPSHTNRMEEMRANPGWYYLSYLKPQAVYDPKWFFLPIAANCVVWAVPRQRALRAFFEGPFCQYLGWISFSLYLVHGPVLATLGDRLYHAAGWISPIPMSQEKLAWWINRFPLSTAGPLSLEPAFILPNIILLPFTLAVARFVTWTIDEPSVKAAQWLWVLVNRKEAVPYQNGNAGNGRVD